MSRKKKKFSGTYTYGTGPALPDDPQRGSAFYIKDSLFKNRLIDTDADPFDIGELLSLHKELAYRSAEQTDNTIVDVIVTMNEEKNRVEFVYRYGVKDE